MADYELLLSSANVDVVSGSPGISLCGAGDNLAALSEVADDKAVRVFLDGLDPDFAHGVNVSGRFSKILGTFGGVPGAFPAGMIILTLKITLDIYSLTHPLACELGPTTLLGGTVFRQWTRDGADLGIGAGTVANTPTGGHYESPDLDLSGLSVFTILASNYGLQRFSTLGDDARLLFDQVGAKGTYTQWSITSVLSLNRHQGCVGSRVEVHATQGMLDDFSVFTFSYDGGSTVATIISRTDSIVVLRVPSIPVGDSFVSGTAVAGEALIGDFEITATCDLNFAPDEAEADDCSTRVMISGEGFVENDVQIVEFDGIPVLATFLDDHTLEAFVPEHDPGVVDVTVKQAQAGTSETIVGGFTFAFLDPRITSIAPSSGLLLGGTPVTINGTGFVEGSTILFGGLPATSVVFIDPTQFTCVTPAHQVGEVTVQIIEP